MNLDLPPIPDAERTPLVETLLGIIDRLHQRVHTLEETVQQLRDEIAVLKGQSPRPKIAPSQLTKPTPPTTPPGQKRPGSAKRAKNASFLTPTAVRLPFPDRPPGAVSNGYEEYLVQALVLDAKVTRSWNGTESIRRVYVQKRKISGSTRSAAGRRCRDTFVSLMKTCRKLGISFWQYLQDRLRKRGQSARLAETIRQRAAEARAARNAEAVPA